MREMQQRPKKMNCTHKNKIIIISERLLKKMLIYSGRWPMGYKETNLVSYKLKNMFDGLEGGGVYPTVFRIRIQESSGSGSRGLL